MTHNAALRKHWGERKRDRQHWDLALREVCGRKRPPQRGPAEVSIMVWRTRLQDPDNAVASVKPVIDALKDLGWLADDTVKLLSLRVGEVKGTKAQSMTAIRWRDLSHES